MPAGRPPLFDSPEEMQAKIDSYFTACDEGTLQEVYDQKRKTVVSIKQRIPYTVPGLAYHLGFATRKGLFDYERKEKFRNTVTRAKLRIERQRNEKAISGEQDPRFAQFDLKNNFDWQDKQEIDHKYAPLQVIVRRYGELEGPEQGRLESGGNALITDSGPRSGGEQTP